MNTINTQHPTPADRMHPNAFPASVECSICKNEFGVTPAEFEATEEVPCPVCEGGQPNPKIRPYDDILTATIAALKEAAALVQTIKDLRAEGKDVEAGKMAYDFYGERYTPYHSCFRFPAAYGFADAIDGIGCPFIDDCAARGINPDTGQAYDVPGGVSGENPPNGNRPDDE